MDPSAGGITLHTANLLEEQGMETAYALLG